MNPLSPRRSGWLCLLLLLCALPSHAQFGFKLPKIPGIPNLDPQTFLTQRLGDALGAGSPLLLDQTSAWEQTDAPGGFKPAPVGGDFSKPLAPGDYTLPVIFYCTQWSIHRPGRGVPYKLGRARGTQAKAISAFLYRGTTRGLAPSMLNADAWRVQAGVPLSQWPAPDQKLVQQLVPEYADSLQGDFFHKIENDYDKSFRFISRKSFTDMLQSMGDVGRAALSLQQARNTLSDQTLAADHLPDMLYEQTGDGTPLQGPPDPDHPSPWMQMGAGVVGRFTDQDGNLGRNLFEFRVAPGASPSVSDIFNGTSDDAGRGIVGYPIGQGAQDPVIEPALEDGPVPGDVVVYRSGNSNTGQIEHVGVVSGVACDQNANIVVTQIISKWAQWGLYAHNPDDSIYGKSWTIWHTNRPEHNSLARLLWPFPAFWIYHTDPDSSGHWAWVGESLSSTGNMYGDFRSPLTVLDAEYYIDSVFHGGYKGLYQKLVKLGPPTYTYNCYGYVFTDANTMNIQPDGVQKILNNNGYFQVHALDTQGGQH